MRCRFCKSRPFAYLSDQGFAVCREHADWFIKKRVQDAIVKYKMFDSQDDVLVAVSGGKDSLALLHILNALGYRAKGYYIDLGIQDSSLAAKDAVEGFSGEFGIDIEIERLEDLFGCSLVELGRIMKRPPCSFCGALKRYYLNKKALEADVIATGHTLSDEAAVLFSSLLKWDKSGLSRQSPALPQKKGFGKKVKPLVFLTERNTAIYCHLHGIEYSDMPCPLSKGATSRIYKRALLSIEDRMPSTMLRFVKGFYKMKGIFVDDMEEPHLTECPECGQPTTSDICTVCRLMAKMMKIKGREGE